MQMQGGSYRQLVVLRASVKHYFPRLNVRFYEGNTLWASRDPEVVVSYDGGKTWDIIARFQINLLDSMLSRVDPISRLLRLGVRERLQIDPESFLAFVSGRIFWWRKGMDKPTLVARVRHGRGPLQQGCCQDATGTCYYGEYWGNKAREEVHIYCWQSDWDQWRLFYRFPPNCIRHIHAVQFDPFSHKIWIATGDRNHECIIGYFEGSADSPRLVTVASGTQMARAVSLIFTADYVYWGSDAGRDTAERSNHIYRWSRKSGQMERVASVGGPVYYSTMDDRGRLFVSTAVEGSPSEPDRFARVWMSEDGTNWQEIARWEKDSYPMLFSYGVLSFPQGVPSNGRLYVVGQGVKGAPGTWVLEV